MPDTVIKDLGLVSEGKITVTMSFRSHESQVDYYITRALWHGELNWIEVIGSIDQSKLGMELLRGNRASHGRLAIRKKSSPIWSPECPPSNHPIMPTLPRPC